MRLCLETPHPTVASDLLSGLIFYGATHQEMASRAAPQYKHSPLILRRSLSSRESRALPTCMGSSTDEWLTVSPVLRKGCPGVNLRRPRRSRCWSRASTRKARSTSSSNPGGNSTTSISCWIRSASPCRNMSHCALSFHSHSAARVLNWME